MDVISRSPVLLKLQLSQEKYERRQLAAQNSTEKEVQRLGKTAIRYLRGMVDELPNTARLVGEFNRLLPKIAQLLGLG